MNRTSIVIDDPPYAAAQTNASECMLGTSFPTYIKGLIIRDAEVGVTGKDH